MARDIAKTDAYTTSRCERKPAARSVDRAGDGDLSRIASRTERRRGDCSERNGGEGRAERRKRRRKTVAKAEQRPDVDAGQRCALAEAGGGRPAGEDAHCVGFEIIRVERAVFTTVTLAGMVVAQLLRSPPSAIVPSSGASNRHVPSRSGLSGNRCAWPGSTSAASASREATASLGMHGAFGQGAGPSAVTAGLQTDRAELSNFRPMRRSR